MRSICASSHVDGREKREAVTGARTDLQVAADPETRCVGFAPSAAPSVAPGR